MRVFPASLEQFRCNGSAQYLDWLDDMLELVASEGIKLVTPKAFDFKVVDRPHDLLVEVRDRNAAKPNSSRLLAGWCWPWSDPLSDGLVDDIQIGDFRFPWESKNGKRPPPAFPRPSTGRSIPRAWGRPARSTRSRGSRCSTWASSWVLT